MATARQATELRCWADLTVIHGAFQARLPELLPAASRTWPNCASGTSPHARHVTGTMCVTSSCSSASNGTYTAIGWTSSPMRACAGLPQFCGDRAEPGFCSRRKREGKGTRKSTLPR